MIAHLAKAEPTLASARDTEKRPTEWDLEHEVELYNLLKHWAQIGVSAKQMGESLANTLHPRDGQS